MNVTLAEQLTYQFYEWEQLGRGWILSDVPIELEPPFTPFFGHKITTPLSVEDDGKHKTLLSTLTSLFKTPQPEIEEEVEDESISIDPFTFINDDPLHYFSLTLPKERTIELARSEELLLMLSIAKAPMSFELIADHERINLQLVCRERDKNQIKSQIRAFIPECIVMESNDEITNHIKPEGFGSIYDFGLRYEFMRPLKMTDTFDPDPHIGLLGVLDSLEKNEHAVIQILFQGTGNPWSESILRAVSDTKGDSFFEDAPEMVPLAKQKISSPLFAVSIRIMGVGSSIENAQNISEDVGSALGRIYSSPHNTLLPFTDPVYDFDTRYFDLVSRTSHRVGMLLNSKELLTLVHLPSDSVVAPKLISDTRKTKAAPAITEGDGIVLGINVHQKVEKKVSVNSAQRLKHTHIIGATGTGKSTLLLSLIVQDITNGNGVAVLDPHGDLIESIITYIPKERVEDVVIIDPADAEYPIGFNILQAHSDVEKEILSSDLVAGFKRLSTSWGDQMNSVFANAILAFLESEKVGTLPELRRFLVEKSYRDTFLKTVTDPNIIYYWQKEYPILKTNSIGPILTRLDTFLRPKVIRNMVGQRKGLDFEQLLNFKKIILVKLSQGLIGTENSYLLGTLIVSKIHQAAMARQMKSKEDRSDFFVYIDEFQNFITPSMSSILSGARKYHLGLILAHQDMQQLVKVDSELASSVVSNSGTRICFRIGDTDVKRFAEGFSFFGPEDLQNLHTGEAIARIDRADFDFSLSTSPLEESTIPSIVQELAIAHSRNKYSTPRKEVEALLLESIADIEIPVAEKLPKEETITPTVSKEEVIKTLLEIKVEEKEVSPPTTDTREQLKQQKEVNEHRSLQLLVKKMAESRGYKALIEESTPDGKGRVDVSLERNNKKIAVEISVTTDAKWEVHNIEKCLKAGYDMVIECSKDLKTLDNLNKKIENTLEDSLRDKVMVMEPSALFAFLDQEVAREASTVKTIKGFRVKVEYDPVSEKEMMKKRESVVRGVLDSRKKNKKK